MGLRRTVSRWIIEGRKEGAIIIKVLSLIIKLINHTIQRTIGWGTRTMWIISKWTIRIVIGNIIGTSKIIYSIFRSPIIRTCITIYLRWTRPKHVTSIMRYSNGSRTWYSKISTGKMTVTVGKRNVRMIVLIRSSIIVRSFTKILTSIIISCIKYCW